MPGPGRPDTSLTSIARASSEHNERQVLAARALENEGRVTAVRLFALVMMGLSQAVIGNATQAPDDDDNTFRFAALLLYGTFTIMAFVMVRRLSVSTTRARFLPLMATSLDVAFVLAMLWADLVTGELELEGSAVLLALIISYSILRYSAVSLWYGTALAIIAFGVSLHWAGQFHWARWTFVSFLYLALALLLYATRSAVRLAFLDLKRRESLSRLLPSKVVDEILAGREDALRPTRREVTVLFSDIRDFTSFSEGRDPEDVMELLDDYFGRMTQVVQGHDGSVNKFIGDGLLAIWGAPGKLDDHAGAAVKAALDMQKVMIELNERRVAAGDAPLAIGIGLHTGPVAAGMLGSGNQSEYSVIGDAVNLASRIEGLTKAYDARVLVSESTWMRLGERFRGERVGEATVKGRKAPVVLYSVTASIPRDERKARPAA